jgi:S1-C subfamily serine protease
MSRNDEAVTEITAARKLADLERSRLNIELERPSSALDRRVLEAERDEYGALAKFAARLLGEVDSSPSRSEKKPQSRSSGSGILINDRVDILTNYHVVAGCKTLTAVDSSKRRSPATVVAAESTTDLAVLRTRSRVVESATFRTGASPQVGESVTAVGFPFVGLLASEANVSFGNIGALAGLGNDASKLQISAPVQPGNSGGPLLDQTGLVIGIVVQKLDALKIARITGDIPQNINFAVKGEIAQQFLKARDVPFSSVLPPSGVLSNTEIAARGMRITVLIECNR